MITSQEIGSLINQEETRLDKIDVIGRFLRDGMGTLTKATEHFDESGWVSDELRHCFRQHVRALVCPAVIRETVLAKYPDDAERGTKVANGVVRQLVSSRVAQLENQLSIRLISEKRAEQIARKATASATDRASALEAQSRMERLLQSTEFAALCNRRVS